MQDILVGFVSIVIALYLGVIAPTTITALSDELTVKRTTMNVTDNFTDVVADKGLITKADYENLVDSLHSTGVTFDVKLTRQMLFVQNGEDHFLARQRVNSAVQDWDASSRILLNKGDHVMVEVTATSFSLGQAISRRVLRLYTPKVHYVTTQVVRN